MEADSTKNTKKPADTVAPDEKSSVQDQVLDAIKRSQEATLQMVTAWSDSVAKLATKLPDMPKMPKMPTMDSLPKASELSDQFFEFADKMLKSEQEFVQKLIDALPGHDKTAN